MIRYIGKVNSAHWVSNPRPSGLQHIASTIGATASVVLVAYREFVCVAVELVMTTIASRVAVALFCPSYVLCCVSGDRD
jgi:hypothetical protein